MQHIILSLQSNFFIIAVVLQRLLSKATFILFIK